MYGSSRVIGKVCSSGSVHEPSVSVSTDPLMSSLCWWNSRWDEQRVSLLLGFPALPGNVVLVAENLSWNFLSIFFLALYSTCKRQSLLQPARSVGCNACIFTPKWWQTQGHLSVVQAQNTYTTFRKSGAWCAGPHVCQQNEKGRRSVFWSSWTQTSLCLRRAEAEHELVYQPCAW